MRRPRRYPEIHDLPEAKRRYTRRVFEILAPAYDRLDGLLSLGFEPWLKRRLLSLLTALRPRRVLDLACGTGALIELSRRRWPKAAFTGADISARMLSRGRKRLGSGPRLIRSDLNALKFPPGSFDLITGGYALGNAAELKKLLDQIRRWLRPGGTAAFLDFAKPASPALARLQRLLVRGWGLALGWLLYRESEVLTYVADGLKYFPHHRDLQTLFRRHGLRLRHAEMWFGLWGIYIVEKS